MGLELLKVFTNKIGTLLFSELQSCIGFGPFFAYVCVSVDFASIMHRCGFVCFFLPFHGVRQKLAIHHNFCSKTFGNLLGNCTL